MTFKTIDAHVGGSGVRLIVDGFPAPRGRTMGAKLTWASRHADDVRRTLVLEPRGHEDLLGAALTEPVEPGSDAGILFMDATGYRALSGHGVVAVATMALERGLLLSAGARIIVFDTAAGTVRVTPQGGRNGQATTSGRHERDRVTAVRVQSVPAFAVHPGLEVTCGARRVRADVVCGGAFYAVVDGESAGLPLDGSHLSELRRAGIAICQAVDARLAVAHPVHAEVTGVAGTIFTGPAHRSSADLRSVTVTVGGVVGRSASGTGTAAIMAVIDAMGLLDHERPFVTEGLLGDHLAARVSARTELAGMPAIVPEFSASAWVTGEHAFDVNPDDPLRTGFRL
jgi:proline racemase